MNQIWSHLSYSRQKSGTIVLTVVKTEEDRHEHAVIQADDLHSLRPAPVHFVDRWNFRRLSYYFLAWLGDLASGHPRDTRLVTALFPQNGVDPSPVRLAGFLFHPGGHPSGTRSRTCCTDGADSSLGPQWAASSRHPWDA